ncbi:Retrovirus-related Pol polyprotein from transposon 412 [Mycena kentingensis (nom. inval.)]|nr:Retrovirus-related Pol polyprotein from transposon 412 [Mycena kentingensis (nom. inval.)]
MDQDSTTPRRQSSRLDAKRKNRQSGRSRRPLLGPADEEYSSPSEVETDGDSRPAAAHLGARRPARSEPDAAEASRLDPTATPLTIRLPPLRSAVVAAEVVAEKAPEVRRQLESEPVTEKPPEVLRPLASATGSAFPGVWDAGRWGLLREPPKRPSPPAGEPPGDPDDDEDGDDGPNKGPVNPRHPFREPANKDRLNMRESSIPPLDLPLPQNNGVSMIAAWKQKLHTTVLEIWAQHLREPSKVSAVFDNRQGGGIKIPVPPTYDGGADVQKFEEHVRAVCFQFRINGLGGPDEDGNCVYLYGPFLKGDARKWYDFYVTGPRREEENWTFAQVLVGLFDRFINTSAIQQAIADYDNVEFDHKTGVDGLLIQMKNTASRMLDAPSAMEFRKKFMRLMPSSIQRTLIHQNIVPEWTKLNTMVEHARLAEHGQKTYLNMKLGSKAGEAKLMAIQEESSESDNENQRLAWSAPKPAKEQLRVVQEQTGGEDDQAGDEEQEYRSDYTAEEDAVQAETTEDRCGMLFFAAQPEDEGVPELLEVSDSDADSEAEADVEDGEESKPMSESELEEFSRRLAARWQVSGSLAESLEHFGAVRKGEADASDERTRRLPLKTTKTPQDRPVKKAGANKCLTAFVRINGMDAFALFDTGCTTEAVSPDFARVSGIKVFPLKTQVPLQLGTVGSRSKINHGMKARVCYGQIESEEYFDIVNLDRYDAIIGIPYMRKHGLVLDLEADVIRRQGSALPRLSLPEEKALVEAAQCCSICRPALTGGAGWKYSRPASGERTESLLKCGTVSTSAS